MQIQIVARNQELTSVQREIVTRRLAFALSRFGGRVGRVSVLLSDVNGPRGGVDTTCRIVARTVPKGELCFEVTDVGIEAAVSRAAERISRRVSTDLERRRALRGSGKAPRVDGGFWRDAPEAEMLAVVADAYATRRQVRCYQDEEVPVWIPKGILRERTGTK